MRYAPKYNWVQVAAKEADELLAAAAWKQQRLITTHAQLKAAEKERQELATLIKQLPSGKQRDNARLSHLALQISLCSEEAKAVRSIVIAEKILATKPCAEVRRQLWAAQRVLAVYQPLPPLLVQPPIIKRQAGWLRRLVNYFTNNTCPI